MFWQRKRLAEFPAAASGSRRVMLKTFVRLAQKAKRGQTTVPRSDRADRGRFAARKIAIVGR
jgi:hypothetical protein